MENGNTVSVEHMTKQDFFNQVASLLELAANFEGQVFIGIMVLTTENEDGTPVEVLDDEIPTRTRIIHNGDGFIHGVGIMHDVTCAMLKDDTINEPKPNSQYTVQ